MITEAELFHDLLRRLRQAATLSQEALAERAGLSVAAVSQLESGRRTRPRLETVRLLAEALTLTGAQRAAFEAAARRSVVPAPTVVVQSGGQAPRTRREVPLVGRTAELALLERHLAGDGPPLLLLAGEPGIGKSRLLKEAAARGARHGWRVLTGGCTRRGGQEPYAPLPAALQRFIERRLPEQRRADLLGCAWLVRLLPELAEEPIEPLPGWTVSPEQERRLMFGAVVRFLSNIPGQAGTLLALDDLQWADPDALDVLAALVRSPAEVPLRVIGAYRDTEVHPQHALSAFLADLAHAGLAMHRRLAPFTEAEMERLLDVLLEGFDAERRALRQRVLHRAGGVPFFAVSCAHALQAADADERSMGAVPWDVAHSVRQRVASLPAAAQAVLDVAAVVGREVPPALLTAVAAQAEREVLTALDVANHARLLVEGEQSYHFAHDVIREVVEGDLGVARRLLLHRQVAEALEQKAPTVPVSAAVLAYHYGRSDAPEKAVAYLEQAGDEALARCAYTAAENAYQELVGQLDRARQPLAAACVREKLGTALHRAGRYDGALAVLEQAADAYRAVRDLDALGCVTGRIGRVHADHGVPTLVVERLESLLAPLEQHNAHRGLAAVSLALTDLFWHAGRYHDACAVAERAVAIGRLLGDDRMLADAQMRWGFALQTAGRFGEALLINDGAARLAEETGDLLTLYWALSGAGDLYADRGEPDRGLAYLERAMAIAERLGDPLLLMFSATSRGMIACVHGAWDQARGDYERARAASRQLDPSWAISLLSGSMGYLSLLEGSWQVAENYLAEASAIVEHSGSVPGWHIVQKVLAYRDLLTGRPDAAHARLSTLGASANSEMERWFGPGHLALQAWALQEVGEGEQAMEAADAAVARARVETLNVPLAEALWIQALVATRLQRWDQAERALGDGFALVRSIPYPHAEARLLQVCGELHIGRGDPGQGRASLHDALNIFRGLGARKDAERTEQLLTIVG